MIGISVTEEVISEKNQMIERLTVCGNLAADYLEELLDICDLDGDIKISLQGDRVCISVDSQTEDLKLLSNPEVVKAIRDLAVLVVQNQTGEYCRLTLSIGNSQEIREAELRKLVNAAIEKLDAGAAAVDMPPMASFDRKLVHQITAELGFVSESKGQGSERHTIISR